MVTFELTKRNDIGGIPKGFKLMVRSSKGSAFDIWPDKEEYLTALEYLPNVRELKLRGDWNSLVQFSWQGHWSVTNKR